MKKNKKLVLEPNQLSKETKVSLRTRVLSATVATAILLPCLILGDWPFFTFVTFALAIAILEIIRCAEKKYSFWLYFTTFILAALLTYWPIFIRLFDALSSQSGVFSYHVYPYFDTLYASIPVMVIGIFALFFNVVLFKNFTVRDACFIFTSVVLISLGFQSILFLRYYPLKDFTNNEGTLFFNMENTFLSSLLIIYVLIATMFTDIGAYFVGIFFGKNKINPRISPKKTWEGFIGGIVISTAFSFLYAFLLAYYGCPILKDVFDIEHWYNILILSLLLPFVSTLGDFVFSSIKRYYEIKDFGKIMPGHGGILDRADSVIFSALTAAIFVIIASNILSGGNPFRW